MQAQTLKDALANLNEQSSLIFEYMEGSPAASSSEFYIDRPDNPTKELETYLINSPADDKILFTGHLGCGKSTELNKLASLPEIKKNFFVLKYSISETLNIIDIDYIDFLISFAANLYTKAAEEKITFDKSILDLIEGWISYIKDDVPDLKVDGSSKKPTKVYRFFKQISTILLRELTLRDNVRNSVKRNITSLIDLINSIVTHIRANLPKGKELLVIIDDLEKIPDVKKADELFIQAGSYMTTPQCKIIFTVPIALYYSLKFQQLSDTFGRTFPLPNIKVYEKKNPKVIDPSGCMHAFFKKRINEKLFDNDALETAILNSGGVAREFVRILKSSCTKALAQDRYTVTKDIVDAVIINLRNEFSRGLEKRHMEVLKAYLNHKDTDDDKTKMELFHSKVLLEYLNGSKWVEINPIVKPLVK